MRNDVLMILNDHRGQLVSASVETSDGVPIMACAGRLGHWHDEFSDATRAVEDRHEWRDELASHYVIGDAHVSVGEASFERAETIYDGVSVVLRGGLQLVITW
jgi:hypothetical protein